MRCSRDLMSACVRLTPLLLILFLHQAYSHADTACPKNRAYWERVGEDDILSAMRIKDNNGVAKNVVIFLGDGMGVTVSTAARIYKGQSLGNCGEEGYLAWERLQNMALVKTYNTDKQVPDSAATATAYLGGVKTNFGTIGVDSDVQIDDCLASIQKENHVNSILYWAQEQGKRTGFVTTTRITHATPAATYAHTSNRDWEADFDMPAKWREICKDIADQLVTENPGRNLNVIMGGGREKFGACTSDETCKKRLDGRNMVEEWLADKEKQGLDAAYVTNPSELQSLSHDVDYVLGLFNKTHLPYKSDMEEFPANYDAPSLEEMMLTALSILEKGLNGFVLLVEGGRIDHGLHEDWTHKSLIEVLEFDQAIEAAMNKLNLEETLLVVTADHSHPITINGYPERGNDILGIAGHNNKSLGTDGLPYTTIMYTNGPGYKFPNKYKVTVSKDVMNQTMDPTSSREVDEDTVEIDDEPQFGITHGKSHMVVRVDQSTESTSGRNYRHLAAVPRKTFGGTHSGEDVAVYAEGPMSHMFHRLHEQTHIAYVMFTAACMGPGVKLCKENGRIPPGDKLVNQFSFSEKTAFAPELSNGVSQPIVTRVNLIDVLGRPVSVGLLTNVSAAAQSFSTAKTLGVSRGSAVGVAIASSCSVEITYEC